MKALFFLLLFSSCLLVAQELTVDSKTILLLHFNNNVNGEQGETASDTADILFENGIHGEGLFSGSTGRLSYSHVNNINAAEGTIEFWIKPKWIGKDGFNHLFVNWGNDMKLVRDGGNNLRFIFKLDDSEANKAFYTGQWKMNEWHHIAATWKIPGIMKTYVDGELKFSNTATTADLITSPQSVLSIGGRPQIDMANAVFDEFRVSSIERTESEIQSSFLKGIPIDSLSLSFKNNKMYITWSQAPILSAYIGGNKYTLPYKNLTWQVSDTSIASFNSEYKLTAYKTGKVKVTVSLKDKSASADVEVIAPLLQSEKDTVSQFLSTPAKNSLYTIPVVIIRYMPTLDGINLDKEKTACETTLQELKERTHTFHTRAKFMLEEGSRYHGYKDSLAVPSLGYKVLDIYNIYEEYPLDKEVPWNKGHYFPDYNQILTRINAKNYVENLGVKEFWVWGWHTEESEQPESNMSSPTTGDISNSSGFNDDMPVFNKTYTLYGYNFTRTQAEAVHNHGHQLESILAYAQYRQHPNDFVFTKAFMGLSDSGRVLGRAGNCHCPPNTIGDYDYNNMTLVESDCEDWNPFGTGKKKFINADTWGNIHYNWPDSNTASIVQRVESQYYIYWFQNMPGYQNGVKYYNNTMTNWWEFTANWDSAITTNLGLFTPPPIFVEEGNKIKPNNYILGQNYPNPFNPVTKIKFTLPSRSNIKMTVYNVIGQSVKELTTGMKEAGNHEVVFEARDLPSGIYFYSLHATSIEGREFRDVKKAVLIK